MSIIIHILICFIITVSNIYAFDLSTYKDNKDNTLEYQYYLLNKKDKDYIRLILQYDSDNFSYEDTISFYNNTIKYNSGIYEYEYNIKNIQVKDNVFYIDIEWSLDGKDYKGNLEVSYINEDKNKCEIYSRQ